ncbi:MAG: excisionase family DNA binding protein [Alteromonadaceae bacterium]
MNFADKSLLTPSEAATLLHVAPTTIRHWAKNGRLPFITTPGGHRRFDKNDVLSLMSQSEDNIKFMYSILIIEDNKAFADMLVQLLASLFPQVNIELAYNGFDGGDLLHTFKPDLILLDLMMPGIDGFSICDRIKLDPLTAGIKVIAMSGDVSKENINRIIALGAETYFAKPLNVKLIQKTLSQYIEQKNNNKKHA